MKTVTNSLGGHGTNRLKRKGINGAGDEKQLKHLHDVIDIVFGGGGFQQYQRKYGTSVI